MKITTGYFNGSAVGFEHANTTTGILSTLTGILRAPEKLMASASSPASTTAVV